MSAPVYARAPHIVWRAGPDRVLVRNVGDLGDHAAAELFGGAALVWLALDEPADLTEIGERLRDAGIAEAAVVDDVGLLVERHLVVERTAT